MIIAWPNNTEEVTDAIREAIGRDITIFYTVSGIPCTVSGCYLDPVTNLSTNQFCVTCGGNYWLETTSGYIINAHVRMLGLDVPYWAAGGIVFQGDAQVQVKYTPETFYVVENSQYFDVDGKIFIKKSFDTRGVPDINRIVVTLVEKEG